MIITDSRRAFTVGLVVELGLGVVAVLSISIFGISSLAEVRWEWAALACGALGVLPLFGFFWLSLQAPLQSFRRIRWALDDYLRPMMERWALWKLFAISLSAGIGEELLFRGLIQQGVSEWLSSSLGGMADWVGLCVASLIFGLAHLITPAYAVIATFMGAYFGWWYWETGNLLAVIVMHTIYDFFALVYYLRFKKDSYRFARST